MIRQQNHSNLLIIKDLAERVGFESALKRIFNNLQSSGRHIKRS